MAKASKSPPRKPAASRKSSGKKPLAAAPAAAPVASPAPVAVPITFTADAAGDGNKKLAIGLVVAAVAILAAFGIWWFLFKKTDTSTMPGTLAKTAVNAPYVDPACIKKGALPVGFPSLRVPIPADGNVNICNTTLMTNKAATLDQQTMYTVHSDCSKNEEIAATGIIKSADSGVVKFIYDPVAKTYQVEKPGCVKGVTTRLCAFDNGGQKAQWLKTTESLNGPTTTTTDNWKTGARSCNWDLVPGTSGGYSLRVPQNAATIPLRGWFFGTALTPANGYWKNSAGETYYALANIVQSNTSETTFILSPWVPE